MLSGSQVPTHSTQPPSVPSTTGDDAIALAESTGLVLDEWQRDCVRAIFAERADNKWAAFEVGIIVPRQNGKGAILEAVELAALFMLNERLVIHSAHEFKTAAEGFLRVKGLVENTPDLHRQVRRYRTAHGDESIELLDGRRLRFLARSRGSARGFSAERIIFDECYDLPAAAISAMLPTMSAQPNPQVIYTTSTPPLIDEKSDHIRRARQRAHSDDPGRLAWFEWSATDDDDPTHPDVWARTNPGLGIRIPVEFVENELHANADGFGVERLGIWPSEDSAQRVIPDAEWAAAADPESAPLDPVALALDVTPDRRFTAAAIAGYRSDGLAHVEVVAHEPGTAWVVDWVTSRTGKFDAIVVDPAGPAGSLILDLEKAGVTVTQSSPRDMAQACGSLFDAVSEGSLRHMDQPVLNAAVGIAEKRPLADAWAWQRKSKGDISPLVAVTLALSAARRPPEQSAPVFAY